MSTIELLGCAEPVSSWLHLLGAMVGVWYLGALARRGTTRTERIALAVFGVGATLALTASGVYHLLAPHSDARAVLQRIDHAGIWLLIASTFTPVHVIMFRGAMRWGVLAFIWVGAITGIVVKTIYFTSMPESLGLLLYLGFSWVGALSGFALARAHGRDAVKPLLSGGVAYTLGGILSVVEFPPVIPGYFGSHEVFHVAVLGALFLHWRLMLDLGHLRSRSAARTARLALDRPTPA